MIRITNSFLAAIFSVVLCSYTQAQISSLSLRIDVNSPYGLSEPWFTIRSALLRHPVIDTVAERPNPETRMGTITTKSGRLLPLDELARLVSECGAGATLREVEAFIDGVVIVRGEKLFLKVPDGEVLLWAEPSACARLTVETKPVRVGGLLRQETIEQRQTFVLEVRVVRTIPNSQRHN